MKLNVFEEQADPCSKIRPNVGSLSASDERSKSCNYSDLLPQDVDFLSTRFTRLVSVRSFSSVFSTRLARSSIISIKENKDAWLTLQKYLGSHQSLIAVVGPPSNNSLNCSVWDGFKELTFLWKLQFWFTDGQGELEREGVVKKKKVQHNSRRQRRSVKSSGERKHDPTNLCPAKLSSEYKGDRQLV